jgi:hypothetical protein
MSNTPPEATKPAFDLSEILPEAVSKAIADGTIKTKEEAEAAMGSHFLDFFKKKGYDEVKTVQIGTHKATQNQLKAASEKLGITLNITDASKTSDLIEQMAEQVKAIKENAGKGGLTEEEKTQIKDLQTLKKQVQGLQSELEQVKREKGEILTKAQSEKLELVKTTFAKSELQQAIKDTAANRRAETSEKTIQKLFDAEYYIDVKVNDKGEPNGYDLRNKETNELVLKGANQHFTSAKDLVLFIMKDGGLDVKQGTSTTPAKPEKGGEEQPQNAFGKLNKSSFKLADYATQYQQNLLKK